MHFLSDQRSQTSLIEGIMAMFENQSWLLLYFIRKTQTGLFLGVNKFIT